MINDKAGSWSVAEARNQVVGGGGPGDGAGWRGGEAPGPWTPRRQGRGRGGRTRASEAALDKRVVEQNICGGPPLLLHKHLPKEVPAGVGHPVWKHGLRGLGGDLENGCHGLVLRPRRFLSQHLNNSAGDAPEVNTDIKKSYLYPVTLYRLHKCVYARDQGCLEAQS